MAWLYYDNILIIDPLIRILYNQKKGKVYKVIFGLGLRFLRLR